MLGGWRMDGANFIVEELAKKEKREASKLIVNMWLICCASSQTAENLTHTYTKVDETTCSHCVPLSKQYKKLDAPPRQSHCGSHTNNWMRPRPRATGGYG